MSSGIAFKWDGERDVMVPLPRFLKACRTEFADEENYILATQEPRSGISHRHFFASVTSAWENLPEDVGIQFATPDSLRKYALIKAGFCDCSTLVCASNKEAQKVAAFIRPIDGFSVVTVSGASVSHYTAKSQSMKAMGKDDFQRSKEAVLDILASMVGVPVASLAANAGKSV